MLSAMSIAPESIVTFLDFFGVFSSTVAATVLAKRQHFDIFGAVMIAVVASIGGGTTRDLLLNRHPLFWLKDLDYAWTITITSIFTQVFYYQFERLDKPFRWFDALALATFTVIGIEVGQMRGATAPVSVLMGVVTAIMGGILRDIVCRQVPLLLQKEVYLSAALVGGVFYFILMHFGVGLWTRDLLTLLLVLAIRACAIIYNWNLPDIAIRRRH